MEISPPTNCPTCHSVLELVNDQLFCRNSKCEAKTGKQLEHFCKTMKIKGFGPKTIEKLGISSILELYDLSEDDFIDAVGEKTGVKLYQEVENSKVKDFPTLLAAFSIPLIGTTAASKLGTVANSISSLTPELMKEAGLGEKATENLWTWLQESWFTELIEIPVKQTGIVKKATEGTQKLDKADNIVVVITGKLDDFKNRTEAKTYLESLGFSVRGSVTKKTDYLIDEEGRTSSSRSKAESYGIEIVTIKQLEEIFQN